MSREDKYLELLTFVYGFLGISTFFCGVIFQNRIIVGLSFCLNILCCLFYRLSEKRFKNRDEIL